jgi:plasmid stabilization system protein ParE
MTLWRVELSDAFRNDAREVLRYTLAEFGERQRAIYRAKVEAAIARLREGPDVPGSAPLRVSSRGLRRLPLARPARHYIVYRLDGDRIVVLRLLHEGMDAERHLPT